MYCFGMNADTINVDDIKYFYQKLKIDNSSRRMNYTFANENYKIEYSDGLITFTINDGSNYSIMSFELNKSMVNVFKDIYKISKQN